MDVKQMSDEQLKARGFELVNLIEMCKRDLNTIQNELNTRNVSVQLPKKEESTVEVKM